MTATPQKMQVYPETHIVTWVDDETGEKVGEAEYTRTDLAQAMVAAAYQDAEDAISHVDQDEDGLGVTWCDASELVKMLSIRTPADARAALDTMLAKAREDREMFAWAMEEVAKAREGALRAAAEAANPKRFVTLDEKAAVSYVRGRILALIDQTAARNP